MVKVTGVCYCGHLLAEEQGVYFHVARFFEDLVLMGRCTQKGCSCNDPRLAKELENYEYKDEKVKEPVWQTKEQL